MLNISVDDKQLSEGLMVAIITELVQCLPSRRDLAIQLAPIISAAMEGSMPTFAEVTKEAVEEVLADPQFREQYKTTVKNVLTRKLGGEIASNLIAASAREVAKKVGSSACFLEEMSQSLTKGW